MSKKYKTKKLSTYITVIQHSKNHSIYNTDFLKLEQSNIYYNWSWNT